MTIDVKKILIRMWKREEFLFFIVFVTIYILLIHNLEFSKMWAFGDLIAYPTDVNIIKHWIIYIWRDEGLGVYNYNLAFWYYVSIFLTSLMFSSLVAQKIVFLSLVPISYISFYIFLRKYIKLKQYSAFFGAFLYGINPVTIAEFVGGAVGQLAVHAVFPLFMLYVYNYISNGVKKHLIIALVLATFLWNPYVAFWYGVLILVPITCFKLKLRNSSRKINVRKIISRMLIISLLIILIYTPIIFTVAVKHKNVEKRSTSILSTVEYTYKDVSFLNLIRLAGNRGSAQAKEFLNYDSLNYYTLFGYLLSMLFFIPIFFKKLHKEQIVIVYIAYALFLLSTGTLLLLKSYPEFIKLHSLLYTLRNPIKMLYPITFLFSLICSLGVETLLNLTKTKRIKYFLSILLLIVLIYNYPAMDGTLGLKKVRDNNYYINEKYYNLKYIFKTIENDTEESYYRILFLPWEYPMCLRIRSEFPNYLGVPLGAGLLNTDIFHIKNIYDSIAINSSKKAEYLQILNTKYIVVDKTFKSYYEGLKWYDRLRSKRVFIFYSHNTYWISGDPLYFYNVFITDPNFDLVYENKNFAIFKNKLFLNDNNFKIIYFNVEKKNNSTISENVGEFNKTIIYLFEAESDLYRSNAKTVKNIDASNGEVLKFVKSGEAWQDIEIVKNGTYRLALKGVGEFKVRIGDHEFILKSNSLNFTYTPLFNLTKGKYKLEILASKDSYLDVIWLYSTKTNQTIEQLFEVKEKPAEIINYTKINPTLWKVKVNATKPFMLSFAEAYDPLWEARVYRDGEKAEVVKSVPLYSVINGFWINETGNLEIIIRYKPQDWFEIGLVISGLTFALCIFYLFYDWRREKGDKWAKEIKNILKKIYKR